MSYSFFFSDDNLESLLALSREYQVESVRTRCQQFIEAESKSRRCVKLTANRLMLFLYVCDQHDLKEPLHHLKQLAVKENCARFKPCLNFDDKFIGTPSYG
jgi:hypothetical protein